MKLVATLLAVAAAASTVDAHGKMTSPAIRLTNAKYNKDAHFSLRNAGNGETQIAPLELLNERGQADNPAAPTFDIMNGCRGIEYEAGGPVTNVSPGQNVPIRWEIAAPHPGYMEVYIVKATKESSGKVMYKQDGAALKRIEDFAKAGGTGSDSVTIPSGISGCGTAGNCALQFYWYSPIAKQTYVNCADIVVAGSGNAASTPAAADTPAAGGGGGASNTPAAGGGSGASSSPAAGGSNSTGGGSNRPGGGSTTPAAGGGGTNTPAAGSSNSNRPGGGSNRPSGGANTPAMPSRAPAPALTPAAPTPAPASGETGADAATPPKKACNKRVRRA